MKMSSAQRPLPSIEIRVPIHFCQSVQAKDLIGIHNLCRADFVDRLVPRLDAEVGFEHVLDAPGAPCG